MHSMPSRHLMTAAAAALFAAAPLGRVHGQTAAPHDSIQADAGFVRHAVADNLLEVRLGEVAQHRATNRNVQQFGQRMANEHGKLQKQWTDLARKHGLKVTPALGPTEKQKLDRLQKVDKSAFDRDYMTAMIRGHTEDVAALKGQVDSARSEPVRKMAAYELPIVQDHLMAARAAGKEVGVDSAVVAQSRDAVKGK
jgi:putative membrane protein